MSITTKLTSLRLVNNDQYTNAIAEANVEIEISDELKTTKHLIVGKFDTNNIANFIDFSNVSDTQAIEWVFSQFSGREELLTKLQEIHKNNVKPENDINNIINNVHNKISLQHPDDDAKIETLSISDEEITSIIEDATDIKILKSSTRGRKNNSNRTLNI